MKISIIPKKIWPARLEFEVVERKGKGHPDTICDYIAEATSRALSRYYIENFGRILHHNVDKGLLIAGRSSPQFGGGEILEPIRVIIGGRATLVVDSKEIPWEEIIREEIKETLEKNYRFLELGENVKLELDLKRGSVDLVGMYEMGEIPKANDTSIGVGFYPHTPLEEIVLKSENILNSEEIKNKFPFIGEDIKVLGIRNGTNVTLIIACAFVDKFVSSKEDYLEKKRKIEEILWSKVLKKYGYEFNVFINTADDPNKDLLYLTVTGTSAECGDDGCVGRGNRSNGIIAPLRPTSIEAIAGKNAYSHVGKIYNLLALEISKRIFHEYGYKNEVILVSQIGRQITDPLAVNIFVYSREYSVERMKKVLNEMLDIEVFLEIQKKVLKGQIVF